MPSSSSWTPARSTQWAADIDDVFSSSIQWGEAMGTVRRDDDTTRDVRQVTLSHLLDNVVILEEAIKELVAIVHARRSLGVDAVRYV
jgi:arginyl-tRNA synthetase